MHTGSTKYARPEQAAKAWNITQSTLRRRAIAGALDRVPDPERPGSFLYSLPVPGGSKGKRTIITLPPRLRHADVLREEVEIPQPEIPVVDQETDWDRLKYLKKRDARITVIHSDVHVPDNDQPAWKVWLKFIKFLQPDRLIYLGDFLDMGSFSTHMDLSKPPNALDEIRAGRVALRQTVDVVPNADRWLFEGNHEQRIRRFIAKHMPHGQGLLELPELLNLKELGYHWYPYPRKRMFDEVMYLHSTSENMHHAHNALLNQDANCVYGHIHRPQLHMKRTGSGRFLWAMGLGCGQDLNGIDGPDWMNGKASTWVHAVGVVMELPNGASWPALVMIRDGVIVWDGKIFTG